MSWPLVANAIGLALVLSFSHVMLRHGALLQQGPLEYPRVAYTCVAMLIYVALFFYYGQLLQRFALSRLYPLYTALSIVCVYLAGAFLFREGITLRGIVGTLLIVAGVIMVAGESRS
jgi:multidrug transporter EmrE-like cation transporter